VQNTLLPIYLNWEGNVEDKLHTACIQLSRQVALSIKNILQKQPTKANYQLLATGGGALNSFLVSSIREECAKNCSLALVVPGMDIVQFKEAALMALMGALRLSNLTNCLSSVTGARQDAMGGRVSGCLMLDA
jgi:anhydro-N-acetylmuramic acid kinase